MPDRKHADGNLSDRDRPGLSFNSRVSCDGLIHNVLSTVCWLKIADLKYVPFDHSVRTPGAIHSRRPRRVRVIQVSHRDLTLTRQRQLVSHHSRN